MRSSERLILHNITYLNYSRPGKKSLTKVACWRKLMEISEAYDYLAHDLLIAKLEAYGLDMASLSLLKIYLANRKQRTKVGSSCSD